ncbi:hypothetical protein G3M53_61180, partial [Streptomyces sp. SID7982]|nr:hypothetical protein [Streptomyces sp. SID7982]
SGAATTASVVAEADGLGEAVPEADGDADFEGFSEGFSDGCSEGGGAWSPSAGRCAVRTGSGFGSGFGAGSPPTGRELWARSWLGVTVGRPFVPSMFVPPKIHRSTLPGRGR